KQRPLLSWGAIRLVRRSGAARTGEPVVPAPEPSDGRSPAVTTMSGFRIDVADLLTHPGARRAVTLEGELSDLGTSAVRVAGPVMAALSLERISEGVVARGTVSAPWQAEGSTCLRGL